MSIVVSQNWLGLEVKYLAAISAS